MRVLLIGGGGREHALAWKLAQEAEVLAAPGNPGIAEVAECHPVLASDLAGILDLCRRTEPDLVVVGPEDPLIAGLANLLREAGFATVGPDRDAAQLEGSKAFSKALMAEAGVPTARFGTFTDVAPAVALARDLFETGGGAVVKASGAALGKGVIVADDLEDAEEAIRSMLGGSTFGDAGSTVVVEERLSGFEFSLLTLCSDGHILSLPVAQDYKRAFDGDRGPNTGGMGSYSPVAAVDDALVRQTEDAVVRPMLECLQRRGIGYRGVLFSGLMQTSAGPKCLEYNVRFGDPETQSVMVRLGAGFADALMATAQGEKIPPIEVVANNTVTVVVASGGYPGDYQRGLPISLGTMPEGVTLFHAGTRMQGGQLVTAGGRVFGVTGVGATLPEARDRAYRGVAQVEFEGRWFRSDIAQ